MLPRAPQRNQNFIRPQILQTFYFSLSKCCQIMSKDQAEIQSHSEDFVQGGGTKNEDWGTLTIA